MSTTTGARVATRGQSEREESGDAPTDRKPDEPATPDRRLRALKADSAVRPQPSRVLDAAPIDIGDPRMALGQLCERCGSGLRRRWRQRGHRRCGADTRHPDDGGADARTHPRHDARA